MKLIATILFVFCAASSAHAEPYVVAAIGDSITAGFNADRIGNNRDLSWATGMREDQMVLSHAHRIADYMEQEVTARNVAIAGSQAKHLDRQINSLAESIPDYTTITIGANDVCDWSEDYEDDIQRFEDDVDNAISRLVDINDQMKIMLSPVPNIVNLRDVAVDKFGCQLIWDTIGICRPLLGRGRTDLERQQFAERLEATNEALESVANRYPDQVLYERELGEIEFAWAHVSGVDCFHPNVAGQNLYAEKTWQFGWFAHLTY